MILNPSETKTQPSKGNFALIYHKSKSNWLIKSNVTVAFARCFLPTCFFLTTNKYETFFLSYFFIWYTLIFFFLSSYFDHLDLKGVFTCQFRVAEWPHSKAAALSQPVQADLHWHFYSSDVPAEDLFLVQTGIDCKK